MPNPPGYTGHWGAMLNGSTQPPATTTYVQPGTVGFLGDQSTLTHYSPPGSGLPGAGATPAGMNWSPAGLRSDGTTLTLDHVYIHGGLYWTGSGSAVITNSILENPINQNWYVFYSTTTSTTGSVTVTDSTLRHLAPDPAVDAAPIWGRNTRPFYITRVETSGMPEGLPCPGNSIIDSCWIHGLVQPDPGASIHLDGIFSQGGSDWIIKNSYVDVPIRNPSDVTAALFFQSGMDTGGQIIGNFIRGGSYTLRNESMVGLVVKDNVFGGYTFGDYYISAPGTISTWTNNKHPDGSTVPYP